MIEKTSNGEILCKEINSCEDIDEELVGHPDSIYNDMVSHRFLFNSLIFKTIKF